MKAIAAVFLGLGFAAYAATAEPYVNQFTDYEDALVSYESSGASTPDALEKYTDYEGAILPIEQTEQAEFAAFELRVDGWD